MLKVDKLEAEIKKAFDETFPKAFECALKMTMPKESNMGNEMAEEYGKLINDMIAEPMAKRLAAAIDYHIRSANVYGTIVTVGSPTTQMAIINSPSPLTNGKVPNTFGIM